MLLPSPYHHVPERTSQPLDARAPVAGIDEGAISATGFTKWRNGGGIGLAITETGAREVKTYGQLVDRGAAGSEEVVQYRVPGGL